jgi:hypothetical protein
MRIHSLQDQNRKGDGPMDETRTYTLEEAHLHFAKTLNGKVWELLEKPERSKSEDELMLYAANASAYHWLIAGTGVNHQRAEWLIARVHTVLGQAGPALSHASRCLELTEEFDRLMQDFDRAFAYEGVARANALAGNSQAAREYIQRAEEAGKAIHDAEDKSIFMSDLNGGDWHGVK